jgi:hypothetical protein
MRLIPYENYGEWLPRDLLKAAAGNPSAAMDIARASAAYPRRIGPRRAA